MKNRYRKIMRLSGYGNVPGAPGGREISRYV